MRYALTKCLATQQKQFIRDYGDAVWDWVCYTYRDRFTVREVAENCPAIMHYSPRTRTDCVRAILHNVMAEYFGNEAKCPIEVRGRWWRLT